MPLKIDAIEEALKAQPLCDAVLKHPSRSSEARCAVGALLHGVGVSDDEMLSLGAEGKNGDTSYIWSQWGDRLSEKYGVEEYDLDELMNANDEVLPWDEIDADLRPFGETVIEDVLRLPSVLMRLRIIQQERPANA